MPTLGLKFRRSYQKRVTWRRRSIIDLFRLNDLHLRAQKFVDVGDEIFLCSFQRVNLFKQIVIPRR